MSLRFARVRPVATACCLVLAAALGACKPSADPADDARIRVVATTTMLGDTVAAIAGDDFETVTIMRPGADPHLYRPTPADASVVARSRLVFTNGLHLEGWAPDLVANAGGQRPLVAVAEQLDVIRMEGFAGGVDPHVWFDVTLWSEVSDRVASALAELSDDAGVRERVAARHAAYRARLEALDRWVRATLATIPPTSRVLVTSHDAFNYFGRAYELQVVGIQGISTESEASQRDVANTIELVRSTGAPAVFAETSVNPTLIERVASETGVVVAGPLYSDSLGPADGPAGTYVDMVVENVRMITEALGGRFEPFEAAGAPPTGD